MNAWTNAWTSRRRHRGQAGASLMLVLAIVAFMSLVIPAVLSLSFTGARITRSVKTDRRAQYTAVSALDAAIQHGRTAMWVGRFGTFCPTTTLAIDGVTASVACTSTTGAFDLDRTITFVSSVGGVDRASARVLYRDGTAGTNGPDVDITMWDADLRT